MAVTTVIFRWFVCVMTDFTFYISQMGFMRVGYNFNGFFCNFSLISMAFEAYLCWNLSFGWVLFVTSLTGDASYFVFICQERWGSLYKRERKIKRGK
jgi:hypothetical protein